jgi:hypothetical protein
MIQSPGPTREEGDKMVACGDEKFKVDSQRGAGGDKRYRGAAVSTVPHGKDISAVDLCNWKLVVGLAENV